MPPYHFTGKRIAFGLFKNEAIKQGWRLEVFTNSNGKFYYCRKDMEMPLVVNGKLLNVHHQIIDYLDDNYDTEYNTIRQLCARLAIDAKIF